MRSKKVNTRTKRRWIAHNLCEANIRADAGKNSLSMPPIFGGRSHSGGIPGVKS